MELFREYLIRITVVAMIVGLSAQLCANAAVRRIVQLAGGLCLALVVLAPLVQVDTSALLRQFRHLETDAAVYTEDASQYMQAQMADIISRQTAAYILDKAPAGTQLTVEVETLPLEGGYCVPSFVTIRGEINAEERSALTDMIQTDLGLTKEQIQWK